MATLPASPALPPRPQNSPEISPSPIPQKTIESTPKTTVFPELTMSSLSRSSSSSISSLDRDMASFDMMRNRRTSGNRVGPTGSKTGSSSSPAGRHILDVPGFGTNGRGGTWVPFDQPTPDHVAGDSMAPIFSQTLYNSTGGQVPAGIQGHFGTTHAAQPPSLGTLPEGMHPSQVVHSITANQLYTNYSYAYARPDGSFTRLVPADEISPIKDIPHTQGPDGLIILPEPCGISPKTQRQLQMASRTVNDGSDSGRNCRNSLVSVGDKVQGCIDAIISHPHPQSYHPNKTTKREKIYCDMWIHKGICAFTQQGCKYKHEMPLDKATQTSLGLFHGLPEWYKRAQAVELAPTGALARSRGRGYSAPQGQKYIENGRPDIAIGRGDGGMGDMGPGLANRRLEQLLQPFPAPAVPPSGMGSATNCSLQNTYSPANFGQATSLVHISSRNGGKPDVSSTDASRTRARARAQTGDRSHDYGTLTGYGSATAAYSARNSQSGLGAGFGGSVGYGRDGGYVDALGGGVKLKSNNPYDMLYTYDGDLDEE